MNLYIITLNVLYICISLQTFHCVCRIADVLIELQHHGNTDYIQWCLRFSCSMSHVYKLLTYQAKKMENDLANWLQHVQQERDQFYELNYFTTPQLLVLREELGLFEASKQKWPKLKSSVMYLLVGISNELTNKSVKESLDQLDFSKPITNSEHADQPIDQSGLEIVEDSTSLYMSKSKGVEKSQIQPDKECNYPHPSLTKNDLNGDQRCLFYNLKASAGYHSFLILLAIEKCASTTSRMIEDIASWCQEHEFEYDFPQDEEDEEDDEEEEDIMTNEVEDVSSKKELNDEDEDMAIKVEDALNKDRFLMEPMHRSVGTPKQINIEPAESNICLEDMTENLSRLPLDENHPDVIVLIKLGLDLDLSINAVQKLPNDLSSAMHYAMSLTEASLMANEQQKGIHEEEAEVEEYACYSTSYLKLYTYFSFRLKKIRIEYLDKTVRNYMPLFKLGRLLHNVANECRCKY